MQARPSTAATSAARRGTRLRTAQTGQLIGGPSGRPRLFRWTSRSGILSPTTTRWRVWRACGWPRSARRWRRRQRRQRERQWRCAPREQQQRAAAASSSASQSADAAIGAQGADGGAADTAEDGAAGGTSGADKGGGSGWQTFHDAYGRPYYFNASTNTTTWELPAGHAAPAPAAAPAADAGGNAATAMEVAPA